MLPVGNRLLFEVFSEIVKNGDSSRQGRDLA